MSPIDLTFESLSELGKNVLHSTIRLYFEKGYKFTLSLF